MAIDLTGKKVLVVGLARSGAAAARLCAREGARVTVTDRRTAAELAPEVHALRNTHQVVHQVNDVARVVVKAAATGRFLRPPGRAFLLLDNHLTKGAAVDGCDAPQA